MAKSVNLTAVNSVQFGALGSDQQLGTLRQVSLHEWKEDSTKDGRDRFSLAETGRDQWSIYLFDLSRKVSLQIDLFKKVILYSDPKQPPRQQYQINSSSSKPNGWLANRVEYGGAASGAFKRISATGWTEDKPDGATAYNFVETGRDDWSVYLRDPDRNVTIQLDLFRLKVVYQEAGGSKQDLYNVVSALTKVNGWLVNRVDYNDGGAGIIGSFVQTGVKAWVEENPAALADPYQFQETNRDEWSVYLHDPSRNVSLQLDLFKAQVLYSDPKTPQFVSYLIARVDVLPKLGLNNGQTVNRVTYGDSPGNILGHFRQTSEQTWSEDTLSDSSLKFQFDEIARDDWSVYLYDESRDTWIQLDLFRNKVSTHQGSAAPDDLYEILSTASVLNGWLVNTAGYDTAPGKPEVLQQVGWTSWIEFEAGNEAIANHFDETGRDDWSVYLHDPSRDVKLQLDLSRRKIVYSDPKSRPHDLYDITAIAHDVEAWRLPHRITSRASLTQDFDPQPDGKPPIPRPVYRTSISLPVYVTSVYVWASEEVTLTINDVSYTIDPVKTVRVTPSALSKLSASIPATTVGCATLFLRTNLMQAGDFHIVMPDVEAHRKIGALKPGALNNARTQLGIGAQFQPEDVDAVQTAMQNVVSTVQYSYNDSYHGVHHDRGLLPANMNDPHFSVDFSAGGAKYAALTTQQVTTLTQGAHRVQPGAAQNLLDDFRNWVTGAATVVVHTAENVTGEVVDTGEKLAEAATQAISRLGEDVVHGDVVAGVGDLVKGGENFGQQLTLGAGSIGKTALEGAGQVLAVTVTFAESAGKEAIQFIADTVDSVNALMTSLLDMIGTLVGEFVGWLLDKVGWGDVLHTHDVLLDAMNGQMDKGVPFFISVKAKSDNFFNETGKKLDSAIDKALVGFGVEDTGVQPVSPEELSGAIEQVESLMGKIFGNGDDSTVALAGLPLLAGGSRGPLSGLITTLEDKLGRDGSTIINALGDAIEHVNRMFSGDTQNAPSEFLGALLEIARAVGHVGLDIVSAVVDVLLDEIIAAIPRVKSIANGEMTVPFASAFYKGLTHGRKLTPLSLAALLVAIPTTILNSQLKGKRPFAAIGVAQGDPASNILIENVSLSDAEIAWGYAYGACQLVQSITSTIADATAFATKRAAVNKLKNDKNAGGIPMTRLGRGDDPDFKDAVDPHEEGMSDALDRHEEGMADAPDAPKDPWEIRRPGGAPQPPKMADFSMLQTVLGVVNLSTNLVSLVAGAPMPPGSYQDMTFVNADSAQDPFEAPAYISQIAFYYLCATTAVDGAVFVATTAATKNGIQQSVLDQFQNYIGILNFVRGLLRFSFMITLCVFDEKKKSALSDSGWMTDATFLQSVQDDPIAALTDLRTKVIGNDNNSPVLPTGGQSVDGSTVVKAYIYLNNLINYYHWATGTPPPSLQLASTSPPSPPPQSAAYRPLGISEKTFGNCMDCFPEIGQLGTLQAIIEGTEGWSLLVTALFDGVAHLAEGVTYCVRTSGQRLY